MTQSYEKLVGPEKAEILEIVKGKAFTCPKCLEREHKAIARRTKRGNLQARIQELEAQLAAKNSK